MAHGNEACSRFGLDLYNKVWETARLRQGLEERWFQDTLQYHGQYDADILKKLEETEGASKLFVNLTRPKTRVLRARLIDILFPTDEANWDILPTPVPRIERAIERQEDAAQGILQAGETERAEALRKEAEEAAKAMRRRMEDQLIECKYVESGRKAIGQACRLGSGVLKGPFGGRSMRRRWAKKNGSKLWTLGTSEDQRPKFEFVNLWDFYPDMDAGSMDDCEFVFQMHRMSKSDLRRMMNNGMFDKEAVQYLLDESPGYAPVAPGHFNTNLQYVRQVENELDETTQNRYIVFEYHGPIEKDKFGQMCDYFDKPEWMSVFDANKDRFQAPNGNVWFCADQVLRFKVNPLQSGELPYSVFRLDPTENNLIGSAGVPRMLRDPQKSLNASWRMAMESGGLEGVPMFVIDRMRVEPQSGSSWKVEPRKIWLTKEGANFTPESGGLPIQSVPINGNLQSLLELANVSRTFMDDESNLPLVAQGSTEGAGAKQTAHGMTLLANAVNVLFRDAARGFDADITIPNMRRLYDWNMQFSKDETVKGDMEIKALGSSVLLVNEIVSQNMLMLMNLVVGSPDAFPMLRFEKMLRLWFKTLRLDQYGLIKTDAEIEKERKEAENQPPPVDPAAEMKLKEAQIRAETELAKAEMERETAIMKLAAQENLTLQQIAAQLEQAQMQSKTKERLMLAEIGVKDEHGTGV